MNKNPNFIYYAIAVLIGACLLLYFGISLYSPKLNIKTSAPYPTTVPQHDEIPTQEDVTNGLTNPPDCSGGYSPCTIEVASCQYHPGTAGKPTFCNDAPYPSQNFTLVLWGRDFSDQDGECLVIDGKITYFQGKPQIVFQPEDTLAISYCK